MSHQKIDNQQQIIDPNAKIQRLKDIYSALLNYPAAQYDIFSGASYIIQRLKDYTHEKDPIIKIRQLFPDGNCEHLLFENDEKSQRQFKRLIEIHKGLALDLDINNINFYAIFHETIKAMETGSFTTDTLIHLREYVAAQCDAMRQKQAYKPSIKNYGSQREEPAFSTPAQISQLIGTFSMFASSALATMQQQGTSLRTGYTEI